MTDHPEKVGQFTEALGLGALSAAVGGIATLPIGLAHFQDSYTTEYHLLMAASVIVMLPVLIVFLIGQRYFVRGIALSGMKG